jgi:hypothetical protein
MRQADRGDFGELIQAALAFYRQPCSDFTLDVWWRVCEPFEMEQVRKALTAHATDPDRGHFAPMPADLVRVLQGTKVDRALMAWAKVFEAMRTVGAYQSVVFDDPAIHATVAYMGGWTKLCQLPEKEQPHAQRRFCEQHRAYSSPAAQGYEFPPVLIGAAESENRLNGRQSQPPALVGDPVACARVRAAGAAGPRVAIQFNQVTGRGPVDELASVRLGNEGTKG